MASQGNAVPALETTAASNDNTSGNVNRFSAPDQVNSANDELPSMSIQRKVENHTVLDHNGKTHPFKSLYSGPDAACRVLVIFVRHFFCGSCQEFIRALSETIKPDFLSHLSVHTSIVIVGCGDPGLIDAYVAETGCPFPIFSDPTRRLYEDLGLVTSTALGPRPEYIRRSLMHIVAGSLMQAMKKIPSGLAMKGGDHRQNGGEFLFELRGEEKQITWCHRMKTTRDHTEISELAQILDPDGHGQPQKA